MNYLGRHDLEALLLGRDGTATVATDSAAAGNGSVTFDGDSHLLTIAPNRSGRARSCVVPNLLTYTGQVVVVDLDGEAYAATAEARRAMGHTVVRLDPFGVTGSETDSLDPIDLLEGLDEPALSSACQDIADLIPFRQFSDDVADYEAFGLLNALIGYIYAVPEKRAFNEIYRTLHSDDVVYSLAVVLDTAGKRISKMTYSEIASWLQKEDRLRSRILARLTSYFATLGNPEVQKSLGKSSVSLSDLRSGAPVSVYLVIPVERIALHSALLRVWIGTLLLAATRSRSSSVRPTLFLLDHCAELGTFPLLESLLKFASGKAFRIWTFWHDVHQLRATYPGDWPAIVSGAGAIQIFGTKDSAAAAEAEALLGLPAGDVWSLGPGDQVVALNGVPRRVRRPDF